MSLITTAVILFLLINVGKINNTVQIGVESLAGLRSSEALG